MEVRRHDPADGVGAAVQGQRAPEHRRVRAELATPETVAEHRGSHGRGDVPFRCRSAADRRPCLQRIEEAAGGAGDADLYRRTSSRQRLPLGADARDRNERVVLAGQVGVFGAGKGPARVAAGWALVEPHQLVRSRHGERPQDHPAHHAEHRRAAACADGEDQDRAQREAGGAEERSHREPEVVHDRRPSEGGARGAPLGRRRRGSSRPSGSGTERSRERSPAVLTRNRSTSNSPDRRRTSDGCACRFPGRAA